MAPSIDDLLRDDHDHLHSVLNRIRQGMSEGDARLPALIGEFSDDLKRHIAFEEQDLFPAMSKSRRPPPDRTVESLVIDHQVILEQLDLLRLNVAHREWTAASAAADRLEIFLQGHNRDEEFGIYRELEAALPSTEREDLLARLHSFSKSPPK